MTQQVREALTEFFGTLILVFFGVGSAVAGIERIGPVGVGLAFGLVLLALAYSIVPTLVATSTRPSRSAFCYAAG